MRAKRSFDSSVVHCGLLGLPDDTMTSNIHIHPGRHLLHYGRDRGLYGSLAGGRTLAGQLDDGGFTDCSGVLSAQNMRRGQVMGPTFAQNMSKPKVVAILKKN